PDVHGAYLALVQTLGVRTAQMHAAFAMRTGNPAFEPEIATAQDYADWKARVRGDAIAALDLLGRASALPSSVAPDARSLIGRRDQALARIDGLPMPSGTVL